MSVLADWMAQRVGIEWAWPAACAATIAAIALLAGFAWLIVNGG